MDGFLLFLHIAAAGTWIGGNVAQFVLKPRFNTPSDRSSFWLGTIDMGRKQYTPAALVLLGTGIWLVARNDAFEYESLFVAIGVVVVVLGAVLGMAVFAPQGRKAAGLRQQGDEAGALAVERRLALAGGIDTALVLVAVAAMVWKWGL